MIYLKSMRYLFLFPSLLLIILSACRKDENITTDPSARLNFSADSIQFDTVFTSIGSTTRRLKVFNPNKKAIRISQIKLAGADNSAFGININGQPNVELNEIELRGNDSLTIFIKVTIDPGLSDLPFVVADSISFLTNGNLQQVQLVAYGQNARFLDNAVISQNTTWDKTLPYVIYNSVSVAQNASLTLQAGTRIYFHKNSKMLIAGTLAVDGSSTDTVTFASDRLERLYNEEPGQWAGIHFLGTSKDNHINHAIIKNALTGIRIDPPQNNPGVNLLLTNSIIKNMSIAGLEAYQASVTGYNNLFYNCGQYLVYAAGGGNFELKQNTFAAFNSSRQTPAVYFTDEQNVNNNITAGLLSIDLVNNIIWGSLADEVVVAARNENLKLFIMQSNLLKSKNVAFTGNGNIINTDPLFEDARNGIFLPLANSPVINRGTDLSSGSIYLNTDISGKARIYPSELGCYEL